MDFLALCKRARSEAGISGDGPSTVDNQTGQLGRLVGWVAEAWRDIQLMRPNWLFMNSEFTFDTVAATRDYDPADYSITDLKLWDTGSFLIYETAIGESDQNELPSLTYARWRDEYRNQMNVRADERPITCTVLANNKLRFEPRPDKIYTVEGEYKRTTQLFAADTDVPTNLPDDFHMIIVWQALTYYGFFENAPDVLDEAETKRGDLLVRLEIEQLPEFSEDYEALA